MPSPSAVDAQQRPQAEMKALILEQTAGDFKPGPKCYHPAKVAQLAVPIAEPGQVLIRIIAAAFNHRDLFIRQSLYPGVIFSTPEQPSIFGADAVGIVKSPNHPLHNKAVLVAPAVNWLSSPLGPDQKLPFGILGNVRQTGGRGTFAEYVVVDKDDLIECPAHLTKGGKQGWCEAAAAPLGGLTAYRSVRTFESLIGDCPSSALTRCSSFSASAVFTKAKVEKGHNVLITGIGGGVAITALQFCVAAGANVWIQRAVELGAKGGINYKDATWPKQLQALLPKDRPYLDSVIDSGGGPIATQVSRLLKDGGTVSCYGQTTGQEVGINMGFVLKNQEYKGSTMGSREEFFESVKFTDRHGIRPVVADVLDGLEEAEKGFEILKNGSQFGKIVIYLGEEQKHKS
ncbi:BZ3500_MvSof-1268-A1-R1_Chr11-1g03271 [Microbotryum saponariae]|uniref:BZ3500_MvSof-1268-A1-R1_Chr11-1g03271 protein n=1 Tax=Microbotryum saponariae TaxID=289078 RepID=A0A2X0NDA0_9BASI|nr:BZ3501_MvSof-1269-A2-R1_Chr11g02846 [Microbotryum saponariae]SDA03856.1 BZ3500_MvSof-1268-A1-R1_Chr11-1g03271 [Microbotryum saponariae]